MSILTDFAASMFRAARSVIGGESVTIAGGTAVSAVLNELVMDRSYEDDGYSRGDTLSAVIELSEWLAAYPGASNQYLGKSATARGGSYRVASVSRGQSFVTLRLESIRKGS